MNQLEAKAAALEAEAAALKAEAAEVRKLANEAEATEPDIETTLAVELTRTNRLWRPKPDETNSSTMFYSCDERESAERAPSDTASPMELAAAPATEAGASADKYRQHPRTLLPAIPGQLEIWNRIPGNFPGDSTPAHPDSRPPGGINGT